MMPSLSVVHTEPSRRRNEAPALSSPPKPTEESIRPGTNHLKPTGTSNSSRPSEATTRSIRLEETAVLPTRAEVGQSGRRSEEHTSNSSHVAISYAVFCLKKKIRHRDGMEAAGMIGMNSVRLDRAVDG